MSTSAIRKAIGAVKDLTSIGIAKVVSNMAPELEVAVVKSTSHDDESVGEKHVREILSLTSYSRIYVSLCITAVSKRLVKTRDWIVALKALMLVHRLLAEGDPEFKHAIMFATRRGTRLVNMSDFQDEAHSNSWDHSAFVRAYSMYLDQRFELLLYELKDMGNADGGDVRVPAREDQWKGGAGREQRDEFPSHGREEKGSAVVSLKKMPTERIFGQIEHLQRLLDRLLACRPTGLAKNSRLVLIALNTVLKESFHLYASICEVLAVLLDRFFEMEHSDCVKALDAYAAAAKQIDKLVAFYNWCKDSGIVRLSEYPEVQRITSKILETLGEFLRDKEKGLRNSDRKGLPPPSPDEESVPDMNEIKAPPSEPAPEVPQPQLSEDLVNLFDDRASLDDQANRMAVALREALPSNGEPPVTSAGQSPAAESGLTDWELALVDSASDLVNQKAELGGRLDTLLLNGMYDQGVVTQFAPGARLSVGSASSVALPGKKAVPALLGPDGPVQAVGRDPFEASAFFPPPSYVQMADMEKQQQLLVEEQASWWQYAAGGMQAPSGFPRVSTGYSVPTGAALPPGMPQVQRVRPPALTYAFV